MKRYRITPIIGTEMENAVKCTPDPMGVELEPEDTYTLQICKVMRIALVVFCVLMAFLILFACLNN